MSFPLVLLRGDDFLEDMPRKLLFWNYASHATCFAMSMGFKLVFNALYNIKISDIEKLDAALAKARRQQRSLITVMNHMLVVDDPGFYAALPLRYHLDIDTVRWGFGAYNICFSNRALALFFSLGKVLGTQRFGEGPFQGSLDAAIRILSPDDTMLLEYAPGSESTPDPIRIQQQAKVTRDLHSMGPEFVNSIKPKPETALVLLSKLPFIRHKTSWFHVFPEGFVLQLQPPHANSMRYFKWGVSRLILECTRTPVVVPIFAHGFEKVAPEDAAGTGIGRYIPKNIGADINITIGDEIDEIKIEAYRQKWRALCEKHIDPENPHDLSQELKTGREAQELRASLAAELRESVLEIRTRLGEFPPEDPRFKSQQFWEQYTRSEGKSAPDVKFIGQNWAIRRLQKHLPEYSEDEPPLP